MTDAGGNGLVVSTLQNGPSQGSSTTLCLDGTSVPFSDPNSTTGASNNSNWMVDDGDDDASLDFLRAYATKGGNFLANFPPLSDQVRPFFKDC